MSDNNDIKNEEEQSGNAKNKRKGKQSSGVTNGQPEEGQDEKAPLSKTAADQDGSPEVTSEQPVQTQAEKGQRDTANGEPPKPRLSFVNELGAFAKKRWAPLTALTPTIPGLFAFWRWFPQYWSGFWRYGLMWLVISGVAVALIWLVALVVCGIRRSQLKPWHWEAALAIGIPFLVGGILLTSFVHRWRTTRNVLILVEPFSGIGEQDGDIGELIKIGIEKAIPPEDKHRVKVMLGNKRENDSTDSAELQEIAKRHFADMIISGSYIDDGGNVHVCTNFRVVHVPKELPAVFRGRESFPQLRVFSKQEIENASVYFVVGPQLECECSLMLGAGAFASENWEMAENYFGKAFCKIEERESEIMDERGRLLESDPNSGTDSEENRQKKKRQLGLLEQEQEQLKSDKALAQLYCGHALINQDKLAESIGRYDKAIKHCKEASAGNVRCQEILARAYVSRGIAYRQRNAFEAAAADFQKVVGASRLTDYFGKRREHEPSTHSAEDDVELYKLAGRWYEHADEYLRDGVLVHAQTEFEMSAEVFRKLGRTSRLAASRRLYDFKYATSLVRLGEVHHRQAGSENPEYATRADEAVKYLEEANKILKDISNDILNDKSKGVLTDANDPNLVVRFDSTIRLRADCLRHLGEAHFAEQRRSQYYAAIESHKEAKGLWDYVDDSNEVAGQWVRIGDVHRRLATLGKTNLAEFAEAIKKYEEAAKEMEAQDYLGFPDSDLDAKRRDFVDEAVVARKAHHLANALAHMAEAHIERHRERDRDTEQKNWETDPNDLSKAIRLLDCAVECYRSVLGELKKEQEEKDADKGGKKGKEKRKYAEVLREERNKDLRDDLAWCLTIRGYGLLMQARHLREQGLPKKKEATLKTLKEAEQVLQEAQGFHRELPGEDEDKDNLAWNLFALAAAQYELVEKDSEKLKAGKRSLLEACNMLREMTRKKKKIWFSDYLEDSLNVLWEHAQETKGKHVKEEDIKKLREWWKSNVVREGKEALDNIIRELEKPEQSQPDSR